MTIFLRPKTLSTLPFLEVATMTSFFTRLLNPRKSNESATALCSYSLDYDSLILLDAEELAEQGILDAYERVLPELRKYADVPLRIEETMDNDLPSYSVRANGRAYVVYSAETEGTEGASWGRATAALFAIVNEQLEGSKVRFYAIGGGNDLGGMFLAPEQAQAAQAGLARKSDWPYIPNQIEPYYGQYQ
jgi:hypothetical protein